MAETPSLLEIHVVTGHLEKECDSFCAVVLDGHKKGKSGVRTNSDNPTWNLFSGLVLQPGDHEIKINVYEKHLIMKSHIGTATLPYPLADPKIKGMELKLDTGGKIVVDVTTTVRNPNISSPNDFMSALTIGIECENEAKKAKVLDCTSDRTMLRLHSTRNSNKFEIYMIDHIRELRHDDVGEEDPLSLHLIYGRKFKPVLFRFKTKEDKDFVYTAIEALMKNWEEHKSSMTEVAWLRYLWLKFDSDHNGQLQRDEVKKILHHINFDMRPEDLKKLFNEIQAEGNPGKYVDYYEFLDLMSQIEQRTEIHDLFGKYAAGDNMTPQEFQTFLKECQNEEISEEEAKKLCNKYTVIGESIMSTSAEVLTQNVTDSLSLDGFQSFIENADNSLFNPEHKKVYQDMSQPLTHYFINSSHNTYLLEDQLKGPSSVEAYIRCILDGCRCVELDCWDGPDDEPVVYHGFTLTSKILFKDILLAIKKYCFQTSDYPIILSFENHCTHDQQQKMAAYCLEILGDLLYYTPPEEAGNYPSPEYFKNKILIKGKKMPANEGDPEEDDDDSDDDADEDLKKKKKENPKPKVAAELSALVSHCQGVHFHDFATSKEKGKYYQMSSFVEGKTEKLAGEFAADWIEYNTRQLSRIYPGGGRVNSSNYDPTLAYNVGAQIVALNHQTGDRGMQILRGMFKQNGGSGYILKPERMRVVPAPEPNNKIVKLTVEIISGNRLPKPKGEHGTEVIDPVVDFEICGVTPEQKMRTEVVNNNGFHPVFNKKETFSITKDQWEVCLGRFVVSDDDFGKDDMIATAVVPLQSFRTGYRTVHLDYSYGSPVLYANLFVHVTIEEE